MMGGGGGVEEGWGWGIKSGARCSTWGGFGQIGCGRRGGGGY